MRIIPLKANSRCLGPQKLRNLHRGNFGSSRYINCVLVKNGAFREHCSSLKTFLHIIQTFICKAYDKVLPLLINVAKFHFNCSELKNNSRGVSLLILLSFVCIIRYNLCTSFQLSGSLFKSFHLQRALLRS